MKGSNGTTGFVPLRRSLEAPAPNVLTSIVRRDWASTAPLLTLRDVEVCVAGNSKPVLEISGLDVSSGEIVGVMGPPGSGKTLLARSIIRLLPRGLSVARGSIEFRSEDVMAASEARLDMIRGQGIGMVFQSPEQALDPLRACSSQFAEAFRRTGLSQTSLMAKFESDLRNLGFVDPQRIIRSMPAQLSGGERQRVLLAIANAQAPDLLIADEPTSGLDSELRTAFIQFIRARASSGRSTLLISHDRRVIEGSAKRIIHLDAGRLVESAPPRPPLPSRYTSRDARKSLLQVDRLHLRHGSTEVLKDLSFRVEAGQAMGIVGPSGSGKTSLARALAGLFKQSGGTIDLYAARPDHHPQAVQLIYQDPSSSLNPSMTIAEAVIEPILLRSVDLAKAEDQLTHLLGRVGIDRELAERRPAALSGGQRQLAAIARALAADPALLVLDEPTASLSEAAAGNVLQLLRELLNDLRIGVVLISHDVDLVEAFCDATIRLAPGSRDLARPEVNALTV